MTLRAFDVPVHGTGTPVASGLSVSFLDTVPLQITSGTHIIDYRVTNSTGSQITFSSIVAKIYGLPRGKFTATLGHTSLVIGAGSSQDSTITITTTSNLLIGDVARIVISGDASAAAYDFTATIYSSQTTFELPNSVFFDCLATTGQTGSLIYDCSIEWNLQGAERPIVYGPWPCGVWTVAGTYVVTCTIYGNDGLVGYGEQTITVSAFSPTMYYCDESLGSNGDGSIGSPWNTFANAMTGVGASTAYGLSFKRGESYIMTSAHAPASGGTQNRWWTAYGSGADPIFECDYDGATFSSTGGASNFRVTGLEFQGRYHPTSGTYPWSTTRARVDANENAKFFNSTNHARFLFHDCVIGGYDYMFHGGFGGSKANIGGTVFSLCDFRYSVAWMFFYQQSDATTGRSAYLGCTTLDSASDQGFARAVGRFQQVQKLFISGGTYDQQNRTTNTGVAMFVEAEDGATSASESHYIYLDRCSIRYQGSSSYPFRAAPSNFSGVNMRVYDVVLDGVIFPAPGGSYINEGGAEFECSGAQMRNCAAMNSISMGVFAPHTDSFPGASSQGRAELLSCTNISLSTEYARHFYETGSTSTWASGKCINGITYAPNATGSGDNGIRFIHLRGIPLTSMTDSHNFAKYSPGSPNANTTYIDNDGTEYQWESPPSGHGASCDYVDPILVSTTDAHLQFTSTCIAAGTELWQKQRDRDGIDRGAAIDIGAYEYVA